MIITQGYQTGFSHILHVAGPVYSSSARDESRRLLQATYTNVIRAADQLKTVTALGMASISTGIYGYPLQDAAPLAIETVAHELSQAQHLRTVVFAMFGKQEFDVFTNAYQQWKGKKEKDLWNEFFGRSYLAWINCWTDSILDTSKCFRVRLLIELKSTFRCMCHRSPEAYGDRKTRRKPVFWFSVSLDHTISSCDSLPWSFSIQLRMAFLMIRREKYNIGFDQENEKNILCNERSPGGHRLDMRQIGEAQ